MDYADTNNTHTIQLASFPVTLRFPILIMNTSETVIRPYTVFVVYSFSSEMTALLQPLHLDLGPLQLIALLLCALAGIYVWHAIDKSIRGRKFPPWSSSPSHYRKSLSDAERPRVGDL